MKVINFFDRVWVNVEKLTCLDFETPFDHDMSWEWFRANFGSGINWDAEGDSEEIVFNLFFDNTRRKVVVPWAKNLRKQKDRMWLFNNLRSIAQALGVDECDFYKRRER